MGVDLLPIGKVVAAHGVRGEVKARLYHAESRLLEVLERIFLRDEQGELREEKLLAVRATPRGPILRLAGVEDRTAAEQLVHGELVVPREWLPEAGEDEVYYHDLVGLRVLDRQGRALGAVAEVFDNGANDVLVVREGGRELLIPFIDEVVVEVDLEEGKLLLDPLEGLLEQ
ncbi:MAG: 16S rRNA processing protein RimM [Deltaproteobacteria bacterium]|nr:16S rRNA processing protein RimM [Deltaproteobacteria bacterium]